MTREEAIKMLKAKLECMTRDVSGSDDDCNHKRCDECHLNYEKGNMGEQKEYLNMAIKALEQEPCEDAISRSDAIRVASGYCHYTNIPKELAKLQSVSVTQKKCNECKYYDGVHKVQGHAPCSYHNIGGVLWNWYCSQWEGVEE